MFKNVLIVGLGGFMGSIARYLTYILIDKRFPSIYPVSTLTVNVIGSFILGIITGFLLKNNIPNDTMRLLLAVGFCGSFTTFSTFAYENLFFINQKLVPTAFIYIFVSLTLGLLAVFAGHWVGKSIL
ncbi:fluoride efflux transporter CrcB [Fulvivirga sp. 29W222]|uniref:Fluoride-specific ion channel FluC n=1 Tax=Fulvivirga marina TaxID=2494733 RepID=A0A937FZF3_9BACT|nr:fluoride efflux transporter CrcB [Fulvivirga marina]MBL6447308.1 fluoride efflux transporter CrcB [Fulvivirga marina]